MDGRTGRVAHGRADPHAGGLTLLGHGEAALGCFCGGSGHGGVGLRGCIGRLYGGLRSRIALHGGGLCSGSRGEFGVHGGGGLHGSCGCNRCSRCCRRSRRGELCLHGIQHFRDGTPGLPCGADHAAGITEAAAQRRDNRGCGPQGLLHRLGCVRYSRLCGLCTQHVTALILCGHTSSQFLRRNNGGVPRHAAGHIELGQFYRVWMISSSGSTGTSGVSNCGCAALLCNGGKRRFKFGGLRQI